MSEQSIEEYLKFEKYIGNWKIKEKLGEGSFGAVFKIERTDILGNLSSSALKILTVPKDKSDIDALVDSGISEDSIPGYLNSILKDMSSEFSIMEKLKGNSNIVSFEDYDVIQHDDGIGWDIIIRMELLTPLVSYLKTNVMSEKEVIKLGIDICSALEMCSKMDIIHRDIKPANIFISDMGNYKLGDFGIARSVEKTKGDASTKIGTLNYMAPEISRGLPYNKNVDYYSLGLVLHRLLNDNREPFTPPAPSVITYEIKEKARRRRISGEPLPNPFHASQGLSDVIRKAAAFNPEERYQSATDMKRDLQIVLGGGQIKNEISAPEILKLEGIKMSNDGEETLPIIGGANAVADEKTTPLVNKVSEEIDDDKTLSVWGDEEEEEGKTVSDILTVGGFKKYLEEATSIIDNNEAFKQGLELESKSKFMDAYRCFKQASEEGHAEATYKLGLYFGQNYMGGMRRTPHILFVKQFECFSKAVEMGYIPALLAVGLCYEKGEGVDKDIEKAKEYYMKADMAGMKVAGRRYDRLVKKAGYNNNNKKKAPVLDYCPLCTAPLPYGRELKFCNKCGGDLTSYIFSAR